MSLTTAPIHNVCTRKHLIQSEVAKLDGFIARSTAALEKIEGQGDWVVYTGGTNCPVYVRFNEDMTGVDFGIGLDRATRFKLRAAAVRMGRKVRNGNGEYGNVIRERDAYELDIANMMLVREMMNDLTSD